MKMRLLKTILLFSFLFTSVLLAQESKEGFLIHLSSNDAHRVGMALSFADKMSDDYPVFIFADIDGISVMLKDSENITYDSFKPSKELIDSLIKKGVKIAVCPMCLEASGHTKYDLSPNIDIVSKEDFFKFNTGRIITLDY